MSNKQQKQIKPVNYVFGRPAKYTQETFHNKVVEYINHRRINSPQPMTLIDFCVFAGVHKDYISEHNTRDGSHNDFSESIDILKTHCEHTLVQFGLMNKINTKMAIFSLKNAYGWKDTHDITTNGDSINKVSIEILQPDPSNFSAPTSIQNDNE